MTEVKEEITLTPEMIEAGLIHLYRYHSERGVSDEETVKAIYRAMRSFEPKNRPEQP